MQSVKLEKTIYAQNWRLYTPQVGDGIVTGRESECGFQVVENIMMFGLISGCTVLSNSQKFIEVYSFLTYIIPQQLFLNDRSSTD